MTVDQSEIIENGHVVSNVLREFAGDQDRFDDDEVELIWAHLDWCEECAGEYDRFKELDEDAGPSSEEAETPVPAAPATEAVTLDAEDFKRATLPGTEELQEELAQPGEESVRPEEIVQPEDQAGRAEVAPEPDDETGQDEESAQPEDRAGRAEVAPEPDDETGQDEETAQPEDQAAQPEETGQSDNPYEEEDEFYPSVGETEDAAEADQSPAFAEPYVAKPEPEKFLRTSDELRSHIKASPSGDMVLECAADLIDVDKPGTKTKAAGETAPTEPPEGTTDEPSGETPVEPSEHTSEEPSEEIFEGLSEETFEGLSDELPDDVEEAAEPVKARKEKPEPEPDIPAEPQAETPAPESSGAADTPAQPRPRPKGPRPAPARTPARSVKVPAFVVAIVAIILIGAAGSMLIKRGQSSHPNPVAGWAPLNVIGTTTPLQEIPLRTVRKGGIPKVEKTDADLNFRGIKELVIAGDLDFITGKAASYDLVVTDNKNVAVFQEQIPDLYLNDGRFFLRLVPRQFTEDRVYTLNLNAIDADGTVRTIGECVFKVLK